MKIPHGWSRKPSEWHQNVSHSALLQGIERGEDRVTLREPQELWDPLSPRPPPVPEATPCPQGHPLSPRPPLALLTPGARGGKGRVLGLAARETTQEK